jgi:hypothetical protein
MLHSKNGSGGAAGHSQLGEDITQVELDGGPAQAQLRGDLSIGQAASQQAEHGALPFTQVVAWVAPRRATGRAYQHASGFWGQGGAPGVGGANGLDQTGGGDILEEVPEGACSQRALDQDLLGQVREYYHPASGLSLTEQLDGGHAADLARKHVKQHDIGTQVCAALERIARGPGLADYRQVAGRPEGHPKALTHYLVLIHYKYPNRFHRGSSASKSADAVLIQYSLTMRHSGARPAFLYSGHLFIFGHAFSDAHDVQTPNRHRFGHRPGDLGGDASIA